MREKKILVVDDSLDFAQALVAQLVHHGRPAVAAGSAQDALDLLDEDPAIAVVLSDVRMPNVNGLDFRRVLKYRYPKLPVVLMTGMPVEADELVRPQVTVLLKPFSIESVLAVLSELE